jgi:hypothetical protein
LVFYYAKPKIEKNSIHITVLAPLKTLSCDPKGILQVLTSFQVLNSISRNEIWNVLKWMNNINASLIQIEIKLGEKSEKLL